MDGNFHLGYLPELSRFRAAAAAPEKNFPPLETGAGSAFHRGLAAESRSSWPSFPRASRKVLLS